MPCISCCQPNIDQVALIQEFACDKRGKQFVICFGDHLSHSFEGGLLWQDGKLLCWPSPHFPPGGYHASQSGWHGQRGRRQAIVCAEGKMLGCFCQLSIRYFILSSLITTTVDTPNCNNLVIEESKKQKVKPWISQSIRKSIEKKISYLILM